MVLYTGTDERDTNESVRKKHGGLAQLGERLPYKQRVRGSSPLTSTMCRLSSIGRATDL